MNVLGILVDVFEHELVLLLKDASLWLKTVDLKVKEFDEVLDIEVALFVLVVQLEETLC